MEPEGGRAERIAPLPRASEVAIKKVPGQCVNTPPAGTARERTLMLHGCQVHTFCPVLVLAGRGLCFILHSGRSPKHETKERQQQQDNKAPHAA